MSCTHVGIAVAVVAKEDHSNRDCLMVAVLSHGDDGVLFGIDKIISIENLVAPIKGCKSLAGKPKIFLFQVFFPPFIFAVSVVW